jgi:hypothetical protein
MPLKDCRIIELPKIEDPRGNLTFVEGDRHIPFDIQRVYYLYDVPGGSERGSHAHRGLQQFIIAYGLYVPPMMWRTLDNFSSGSVCMVLASARYTEDDYIRDHAQFLHEVGMLGHAE